MNRVRQFVICFWLQFKILLFSPFEGFLAVVCPLMFATAALLVYRVNGDPEAMLYAGIGAAAMGIWTSQTVSATTLVQRERRAGTLELLVAAPTPFSLVLLPITCAMATIGLYSVVATLLWDWWLFDIALPIENRPLFVLSILWPPSPSPSSASCSRSPPSDTAPSWALGAALEYPGWLLCGFLVPLDLLPDLLRPISWALAPTWAVEGMRAAAAGECAWRDLAICGAVGLAYAALAGWLGVRLINAARRDATLALS